MFENPGCLLCKAFINETLITAVNYKVLLNINVTTESLIFVTYS